MFSAAAETLKLLGETASISISAYSEVQQQCFLCQNRQPLPQPHHVNKGDGSSLCEELHN